MVVGPEQMREGRAPFPQATHNQRLHSFTGDHSNPQAIEAAGSSGERPATPLPSPLAVRAALSHLPHPTMRRNQALSLLGLLALAAGALALRPEPAAGAADLRAAATSDDKDLPWFCHNLQCPRFTVINTTEDYEVCVLVGWRVAVPQALPPGPRSTPAGQGVREQSCSSDYGWPACLQARYYEAGAWASTGERAAFGHLGAQPAWPCSAAAPRHVTQKHHPPCPCTADVEAYAFALAANMGFRRLFGYIDGQNEEAVKIPVRQTGRAAERGSKLGLLRFTEECCARSLLLFGGTKSCSHSCRFAADDGTCAHQDLRSSGAVLQGKFCSVVGLFGERIRGALSLPCSGSAWKCLQFASGTSPCCLACPPPSARFHCTLPMQSNFTVSFFLPYRLHRHAPKPNNPDVYIQPSPAFTAFVAQVGGRGEGGGCGGQQQYHS